MNYWALILMTMGAGTLGAETVPVENHSFEQTELGADGKQADAEVPGWKVSGKAGVFVNGLHGNDMAGADGSKVAYLDGAQASAFTQDVLKRIQPGATYSLSALVGLREDSRLAKDSSLLLRLQFHDVITGKFIR